MPKLCTNMKKMHWSEVSKGVYYYNMSFYPTATNQRRYQNGNKFHSLCGLSIARNGSDCDVF